jgi:hypothetical protein
MSFKAFHVPEIAASGGNAVATTYTFDVGQFRDKGFDFRRDAGDAWTGSLDGSVAGINWTQINNLTASAQGAIADHYNYVRLIITVTGAINLAVTVLKIAGKEIF